MGIFERPIRVGGNILLCGKRNSRFPYHCMIGPDWACMSFVYIAIILIHAFVLGLSSPCLGWPTLAIGLTGFTVLMIAYSRVACSNPGIVFQTTRSPVKEKDEDAEVEKKKEKEDDDVEMGKMQEKEEIESNSSRGSSNNGDDGSGSLLKRKSVESATKSTAISPINNNNNSSSNITTDNVTAIVNTQGAVPKPKEVPCGHCQFDRPLKARHCMYCGCCINGLDHHCPWSGRCIGEDNLRAFHFFVGFVCFEIYLMGGIFVYWLVSCYSDLGLPQGAPIS